MSAKTGWCGRSLRESLAAVLVLALLAPALGAKERRGAQLVVTKKDKTVLQGELLAVRGNTLILMLEANTAGVECNFKEVAGITVVKKSRFGKGLLWGGLIGAGAGAVIGAVAYKSSANNWFFFTRGSAAGASALVVGVVGAVIGGIVGTAAGWDEKIAITADDPVSLARIAFRLRELARDRG